MIDYLARVGCEVRNEGDGTRMLFADRSALFQNLSTDAVRTVINEAMETVVPYFTTNASRIGLAIEPRQIEEAALRVTVSWITMYNNWRGFYPEHRNHPLTIGTEELRSTRTFEQCYDYCKHLFGSDFRRYVAALLGLSDKEYARIEKRLETYWNK